VFSDFGQPDVVISDNGPQFSSQEFRDFCKSHSIKHSTSSPLHPSGNGQVERSVGSIKVMMHKCLSEGQDWYKGLTTIRNTPIGEGLLSPSELLQGRVLKDDYPVEVKRYQVQSYDLEQVRMLLGFRKSKDKYYHDQHSRQEKTLLVPGQQVHLKTAAGAWRHGEVQDIVGDRSYLVKTGKTEVRRNRKDLRPSQVQVSAQLPLPVTAYNPIVATAESGKSAVTRDDSISGKDNCDPEPLPMSAADAQPVSRAGRRLRKPKWHDDYQMSF